MDMDGLYVGSVVHYVHSDAHRLAGQHRAAIVVGMECGKGAEATSANLVVLQDAHDDLADALKLHADVPYSENGDPGSWHQIEGVGRFGEVSDEPVGGETEKKTRGKKADKADDKPETPDPENDDKPVEKTGG